MIHSIDHLCKVLNINKLKLNEILSNIDSFYYEVHIPKFKNGKIKLNKDGTPRDRIINPSTGELKKIQKLINRFLQHKIVFEQYAFGGIKKRSNITNAKLHKGKKFVFQTDMQDFYPFINSKSVYKTFCNNNFSADISSILTKLTTYKGHLPQGTPTSSAIANLVFSLHAGKQIREFANNNGLTFSTFVDDVTISAPFDFKDKISQILEIIRSNGFKISHSKTSYKTNHPNITGVKCGNNYLTTTDEFDEKLSNLDNKTEKQINGLLMYKENVFNANKSSKKS